MIKREWQKLWRNKFLVLAVLIMALIPTLYATIFLASMWDPYGQIDQLPVAVVNNDKPVTYESKKLSVGSDLVDRLKKEKPLNCNFVSAATAAAGLKDHSYYMVITIPEDFSKNATTLMDDSPKKMELHYELNSGANFIASKLSTSASDRITKQVSEEVTKTYAETLFSKLDEIKDGFSAAADGSQKLDSGAKELATGNQTITQNLQKLASSSLTFRDGASQLEVGIKQYQAGAQQLASGTQQLADGAGQMQSGVSALNTGAGTLQKGVTQYTQGAGKIDSGLQKLSKNSQSLKSGAAQVSQGLTQLQTQLPALTSGLTKLSEGGASLQEGIDAYTSGVSQLSAGAKQLEQNGGQLGSGASSLASGAETVSTTLQAAAQKFQQSDPAAAAVMQKIAAQVNSSLVPGAKQLANGVSTYTTGVSTLASGLEKLDSSTASLKAGSKQLTDGVQQIGAKAPALSKGLQQLTVGASAVSSGVNAYTDGVAQLTAGSTTLTKNSAALVSGSQQLSSGLTQLSGKVPALVSGVQQVNSGAQKLGTSANALVSGADQLGSGAQQISDGAGKLADGSATLGSGLSTLKNGTAELSTKLSDGNKKVSDVHTSDATSQMMSEPVTAVLSDYAPAKDNLHGMAPYMMSIALFIGGIVMCFIYPVFDPSVESPRNGTVWWASKASVWMLVAVAQAVVEVTMLMALNGLRPENVGLTYLVAILTSMAFMALISLFATALGRVGSFIMIVFMILQISGSAGTYPIEITNGFYQKLRPYLPMTYSVDAFRQAVDMGSKGPGVAGDLFVLIMVAMVSTFLCIIFYSARVFVKERKGHELAPAILSAQMMHD
ncbi:MULTISPECIES: YhgE/Pip domain-containing protein [Caproicibacterium]|uniref:YhgE/Pip domain-containing protein n=1 Tax=Caproicibacterium argilliputei TaxID=3030016 RepID=A0AA97H1Z8_9FIRM|nr:YhgE/Pip domain-containing protein [Caproicibacterium argilliputei]WOC31802.1 YhgE/Pip domain-containing protein [Caproicibacterium argilliputei]